MGRHASVIHSVSVDFGDCEWKFSQPCWMAASVTSISNWKCELLSHLGSSALFPTVPLIEAESQPGASPSAIDR